MKSLRREIKTLRKRYYDEYWRISKFRQDTVGVKDTELAKLQPVIKRTSILKGKLSRRKGHSVMFSLVENGRKMRFSPDYYRFFKGLLNKHIDIVESYPSLVNEMSLTYLVAVFEGYVIDLIRLVLTIATTKRSASTI